MCAHEPATVNLKSLRPDESGMEAQRPEPVRAARSGFQLFQDPCTLTAPGVEIRSRRSM